MTEPRWLRTIEILAIHEALITTHGGAVGVREDGLLDSALASPRNHFAHDETDLFLLAASYATSITRNHPFVDGNKRMALTAAGVFLELNGWRLEAPEAESVTAILQLESRELSPEEFAAWLRENSVAQT